MILQLFSIHFVPNVFQLQVNTILTNRVISQAAPIATLQSQQKRFKSDLYEPDYLIVRTSQYTFWMLFQKIIL